MITCRTKYVARVGVPLEVAQSNLDGVDCSRELQEICTASRKLTNGKYGQSPCASDYVLVLGLVTAPGNNSS